MYHHTLHVLIKILSKSHFSNQKAKTNSFLSFDHPSISISRIRSFRSAPRRDQRIDICGGARSMPRYAIDLWAMLWCIGKLSAGHGMIDRYTQRGVSLDRMVLYVQEVVTLQKKYLIYLHRKMRFTPFINYYDTLCWILFVYRAKLF